MFVLLFAKAHSDMVNRSGLMKFSAKFEEPFFIIMTIKTV